MRMPHIFYGRSLWTGKPFDSPLLGPYLRLRNDPAPSVVVAHDVPQADYEQMRNLLTQMALNDGLGASMRYKDGTITLFRSVRVDHLHEAVTTIHRLGTFDKLGLGHLTPYTQIRYGPFFNTPPGQQARWESYFRALIKRMKNPFVTLSHHHEDHPTVPYESGECWVISRQI